MLNPVYQELISDGDYFDLKSDESLYLDVRTSSLKERFANSTSDSSKRSSDKKKLRLIVCAHSLGQYLYISSKKRKSQNISIYF